MVGYLSNPDRGIRQQPEHASESRPRAELGCPVDVSNR